jgi:hypothetical protein
MTDEIGQKLTTIRAALATGGLGAPRLRGVDGFAWATGGASNVVQEHPWDAPAERERFVAVEAGGEVASDRPRGGERSRWTGGAAPRSGSARRARGRRNRVRGSERAP